MFKAIIKILGFVVGLASRVKNIRRQKKDEELEKEIVDAISSADSADGVRNDDK